MKVYLKHFDNQKAIEDFLNKNDINNYTIEKLNNKIELNIYDNKYNKEELDILKRYFYFYDIFYWSDKGIENVTLWENPLELMMFYQNSRIYLLILSLMS